MTQHPTDASAPGGAAAQPRPRHALPDDAPEFAPPTDAVGTELAESELVDAESRPPRPQMERPPAPTSPALVRPRIVDRVLGLYYLGLGAGAVGVFSAMLWRGGAREKLLAMMAEATADEARKGQVANLVQYGAVAVVVALLFAQLALVVRLAAGRRGARPGLVVVVAAQVLLYLFAADIYSATGWEGVVVQVGLGLQAATAVVATLLSWAPAVGEWLGLRRAARQH